MLYTMLSYSTITLFEKVHEKSKLRDESTKLRKESSIYANLEINQATKPRFADLTHLMHTVLPVRNSMFYTMPDVKSKQCVLIAKAGMAVPTYDMSSERLHEHIMTFKHHVENYKLPANLAKFPRNNRNSQCAT
jgi:hypothetical protein